ncbi:oligosaccharide flippase family protein [Vibrio profundum]|uniref:lipopolysaccharide biosynthesis protein n=1 Tax=Vibrio profundum TaxID=2910247 RepID=UPI003D0D7200
MSERKTLSPLKSMLLYAFSLFLMKGISLLMLPLMARYLSPAQLGSLELIATTTAFISLLVAVAMHENLYRFIGILNCSSEQKRQAGVLYFTCLIISALAALLLILLIQAFKQHISVFSEYQLILMTIVVCFESALAISMAWLRMQDKVMVFFSVTVTCTIMQACLIVWALIVQPNVTLIFAIGVFATFIQFSLLHFINQFQFALPRRNELTRYLRYSSPLMMSAIVAFTLCGAERWVIAYTSSVEELGLYAVAAKFALAMCILAQPFHMWWMPKRFQSIEQQGARHTTNTTQIGIAYLCLLSVVVGIGSQIFIQLALPQSYHGAAQLVIATVIIALLKETSELINIGILYKKRTKILFKINVACSLLGGLLFLCSMQWEIVGVMLSLIIAQLGRTLLIARYSQHCYPLPYQCVPLIVMIVTSVIYLVASYWVSNIIGLMGLILLALFTLFALAHLGKITVLTMPAFLPRVLVR